MRRVYNADDIASFFVKKGVTPLKLQKLLYYSQVWYIKRRNNILFNDPIKAWVFGPVVSSVWHKFKVVKRNHQIAPYRYFYPYDFILPNSILRHLEDVWESYGHLTGAELVDLTHSEAPWRISRKGLLKSEPSDNNIELNEITLKEYQLDLFDKIPYAQSKKSLGYFGT